MPIPSFTVATTPATFEAYEYYKFGNALEEIKFNANTTQKPLKADELRVKIFSAAVNPVDYKLVTYGPHILPHAPTTENPFHVGFDGRQGGRDRQRRQGLQAQQHVVE
ncbi:hypothetical protein PC116_g14966 [Phytophthora cactorum]|uniref:Uncharacterized protein n=1 Tax=Phytophthora cactorum TaxID=29920 RepID=A0A8T0Z7M4_9STRA|nr:hypothetical protein PC111_g18827 [Phytophthora cactorum]KAG2830607.1 hypothetical protein PC112_g7599 [Phytophthora cactorum]KAG2858478.1 hypothetical protein PC113_g9757 [Phytophthora cactorum]KAG2872945.1 hypothetical protein PC114_g26102 [Phytophthora cactorum]KAG2892583.1 hypothetical protein PC115_g18758 [Phytophthora cactorum]